MSKELNEVVEREVNVDLKKREFMEKVGKYAVVGAGMATLMTPTASSANCYGHTIKFKCGNNGWGNGDQFAPGRSLRHNRAENDRYRRTHRKHGVAKPN